MPTSRWLSRHACHALLCTVAAATVAHAQNEAPPKPADQPEAPAAKEAPPVDPFKVPDGKTPEELQAFLTRLSQTPPKERNLESVREHLQKVEALVEQVQKKDLDEATALMAADFRFQLLRQLGRIGVADADAEREKMVKELQASKLPKVAERGLVYSLAGRVGNLGEMDTAARKKLIEDLAAFIMAGDVTQERYELASSTPEFLANLGDNELAVQASEAFAAAFESRKDERLKDLIDSLRSTGRRLGLVGNTMEVKGTTVDGKEFNLEQLKGQVVLVDFWATWCGPCLQEMPHVREMYEGYHSKGFEVVGISLDQKKEVLMSFLEAEKLPWIQLYSEAEGTGGWSNPIAKHYGISGIPTAILVGKDGKVVSLDARGDELTKLLGKLLGEPAPKAAEKAAPVKEM